MRLLVWRAVSLAIGFSAGLTGSASSQATDAVPARRYLVSLHGYSGFIDSTGRTVIPLRFDAAGPFIEGLAFVRIHGQWGYIDTSGTIVIAPQFAGPGIFHEGLASVLFGEKLGYIDRTGRVVIAPQFDEAGMFHDGRAGVRTGDTKGYIDRTGTMVIRSGSRANIPPDFSDGLAAIEVNGQWGFMDTTGAVVINPQYQESLLPFGPSFVDGFAAVPIDGKWGFIDRTGRLVIPAQFQWAKWFDNGLAAVGVGGQWGYIDTTGAFVIAPQFADVGSGGFSEGLAPVRVGDKWGYIDRAGRLVIAAQFEPQERFGMIGGFWGGIADVRRGDEYGYIDRTGRFVWSSLRANTTAVVASSGALVDRVAALLKRGEAVEAGAPGEQTIEQLLDEVATAATQLSDYVNRQPNDVRAAILAVRLARLRYVMQNSGVHQVDNTRTLASVAAGYASYHAALDRAMAVEPNNAEVHYWKARLYGFSYDWLSTLYSGMDTPAAEVALSQAYGDSAVRYGRRAVELAPAETRYREALAIFLTLRQREQEAAAVLRNVAGGHHPVSLLLADWLAIPVPAGAVTPPAEARGVAAIRMVDEAIKDEPLLEAIQHNSYLRVHTYVVAMPADSVEIFYRTHWPGFRFFLMETQQSEGTRTRTLNQFLKWHDGQVVPAQTMGQVPSLPTDGIMIMVLETTNPSEEVRRQLPLRIGSVFCTLSFVNLRRVAAR